MRYFKGNFISPGSGRTQQETEKEDSPRTSVWQLTTPERENAATFLEFTSITPFLWHQGSFKCFYCSETFLEVPAVLQHTATHSIPNRFTLLKEFVKSGKRVIKVNVSQMMCKICELEFSKLDDIRDHLVNVHKKIFCKAGNGLMAYNLNATSGMLACHQCAKEFASFFSLNRHMNVHENVVCETCGLGFMTFQRLRKHMVVHQNGNHKCSQCTKVFTTKMQLHSHAEKCHEVTNLKTIKPLKCTQCSERFSEHYKKMTHLRDVHGVIFKFECHTCKVVYHTRRSLTEHTRKVHAQNIQCTTCGQCFGTLTKLRFHSRTHTGERNFVCSICQKAFMHEKLLRKHMKTHGFSCTCMLCGSGFLNKTDYLEHKRQWHPQQPRASTAAS